MVLCLSANSVLPQFVQCVCVSRCVAVLNHRLYSNVGVSGGGELLVVVVWGGGGGGGRVRVCMCASICYINVLGWEWSTASFGAGVFVDDGWFQQPHLADSDWALGLGELGLG